MMPLENYIFIFLLLVFISGSYSQETRTCKAIGEYCQTHSECCSLSCLSFNLKCVPVHHHQQQGYYPSLNAVAAQVDLSNRNAQLPISLNELTNQVFNPQQTSFGEIGQRFTPEVAQAPISCTPNGQLCHSDSVCCSQRCHSILHHCIISWVVPKA